jgi:hypothetical protein
VRTDQQKSWDFRGLLPPTRGHSTRFVPLYPEWATLPGTQFSAGSSWKIWIYAYFSWRPRQDCDLQLRRLLLDLANFAIFLAQAPEITSEICSHPFRMAVQKSDLASTLQHDFPFCSAQSCKVSCKVFAGRRRPADLACTATPYTGQAIRRVARAEVIVVDAGEAGMHGGDPRQGRLKSGGRRDQRLKQTGGYRNTINDNVVLILMIFASEGSKLPKSSGAGRRRRHKSVARQQEGLAPSGPPCAHRRDLDRLGQTSVAPAHCPVLTGPGRSVRFRGRSRCL